MPFCKLSRLQGRLESMMGDDDGNERAFEGEEDLNRRQRDVLVYAARNPGWRTTFAEHMDVYKVAYATAHDDLEGLERKGFLSLVKLGRAYAFQATPFLLDFTESKHREGKGR